MQTTMQALRALQAITKDGKTLVTAPLGGATPNADTAALLAYLVAGFAVPDDGRFRPSLPCPPTEKIGWCRIAWALAVESRRQAEAVGPLEALRSVIAKGGDTDTNGAVAGAVLGAAYGTKAWTGWVTEGLAEAPRCERLAGRLVGDPP